MNDDEYYIPEDEDDQAAADLAEYEQYVIDQNRKARALLTHPEAMANARPIADELARLVLQHAKVGGMTALDEMIRDSLCEDVLVNALEGSPALLGLPISREGYIAIRKTLDAACRAFEALLTPEAPR